MAHELKRVDNGNGTHTVTIALGAVDTKHIVVLNEHLDTDTYGAILAHAQDRHTDLVRVREGFGV